MATLTITEAIQAVRGLSHQPISTPGELEAWYRGSRQLKDAILASNLWDKMPHFIAHYLDDADLRSTSAEYRSTQEGELQMALSAWEKERAV